MKETMLTIDTKNQQESTGDLFGIFFEDINHAADGGLYAEMVRNRSFEFDSIDNVEYHALTAWEKVERGANVELNVLTENPYSKKNPHYVEMKITQANDGAAGIRNVGYNQGIPVRAGESYYYTFYAKSSTISQVKIAIESITGNENGSKEIKITSNEWTKYEGELKAFDTDFSSRLSITASEEGIISLDFISLFPKNTYKNRRNGMRRDLATMLEELHPKFMRFPGGCLVHDGSLNSEDRDSMYRWKNTIGPVEERPARRNNWQYNQSLGLGFYEYFQFCEDIGAKPIPVLPGGFDPHHDRIVPLNELGPWIQDALDLIEFANGDESSEWGAKRVALGHKEPFHLEYIAIGNEEVREPFFERYPYFHKAIKEKYPEMKVINSAGPFAAGGEYERGWASARANHSDLIDEHYYESPEWMLANHHRYDTFDTTEPMVFLGEYGSWGHTFYNALVEATYMIGLERNTKVVKLACYAPLFCNADYMNWNTDLIWFDNHRVYGACSYYVQKLFSDNQGDYRLKITGDGLQIPKVSLEAMDGEIAFSNFSAKVKYTDVSVTNDLTGETMSFEDMILEPDEEKVILDHVNTSSYTIRAKATELDGKNGFILKYARKDTDNFMSWTIGGWQNMDTHLNEITNGRDALLSQDSFRVVPEKEYQLELKIDGRILQASVDGKVIMTADNKQPVIEPLYYSAAKDEKTGDIILKVVNMQKSPMETTICLDGMEGAVTGEMITLVAHSLEDENTFENPLNVYPQTKAVSFQEHCFDIEFAKESLTVLRLGNKR